MAPSDVCLEIGTPNVMVLGDGTFGRRLGHEGGPLMPGSSDLIRGPQGAPHEGENSRLGGPGPSPDSKSACASMLDFPDSRTVRKTCFV